MLRNHHWSDKKMSLPPYYLVHHLLTCWQNWWIVSSIIDCLSAQVLFYDKLFDRKQAIVRLILGIFEKQSIFLHEKFKSFIRKTNAIGTNSTMQLWKHRILIIRFIFIFFTKIIFFGKFAFYGILPLLHTALVINFNLFIHTWNCSFQLWKYFATKKVMYLTFQVIFNKNFSQKSVEIKALLRITYHLTFLCAHYTNDYVN